MTILQATSKRTEKAEKKELISGRYLPPKSRRDKVKLESLLAKLHHKAS